MRVYEAYLNKMSVLLHILFATALRVTFDGGRPTVVPLPLHDGRTALQRWLMETPHSANDRIASLITSLAVLDARRNDEAGLVGIKHDNDIKAVALLERSPDRSSLRLHTVQTQDKYSGTLLVNVLARQTAYNLTLSHTVDDRWRVAFMYARPVPNETQDETFQPI